MKVKLIKSPFIQSEIRGAGFYGDNLISFLKIYKDLEIVDQGQDVTHYLYFDLFFLTLPIVRKEKTVVTVYDLTPIVLSNLFPRGIKGEIKWQIQKNNLKTVDRIITISQSAKNDIIKYIGYPAERIDVTYLAPGTTCRPLKLKRDKSVLYIGDINQNKNLSVLFRAMSLLKDHKLVLVGKAIAESKDIRDEINSLDFSDRVIFKGFVTEEEKIELLNRSKVYVQPSIYEGFGLPVVEAMACGTPVICGNNSSLPEVAGNAATYVDITNYQDLADKIKNIKANEKECILQSKKFSWEMTAKLTYEAYKRVLGK